MNEQLYELFLLTLMLYVGHTAVKRAVMQYIDSLQIVSLPHSIALSNASQMTLPESCLFLPNRSCKNCFSTFLIV